MDLIADYFESIRFDVTINVVSGLSHWIRVLEDDPTYHLLVDEVRHPANRLWLVTRLKKLMEEDIDPKYAHPKDTAMAVYIRCLLTVEPKYKKVLIHTFEEACPPNLYYALRMVGESYGEENA